MRGGHGCCGWPETAQRHMGRCAQFCFTPRSACTKSFQTWERCIVAASDPTRRSARRWASSQVPPSPSRMQWRKWSVALNIVPGAMTMFSARHAWNSASESMPRGSSAHRIRPPCRVGDPRALREVPCDQPACFVDTRCQARAHLAIASLDARLREQIGQRALEHHRLAAAGCLLQARQVLAPASGLHPTQPQARCDRLGERAADHHVPAGVERAHRAALLVAARPCRCRAHLRSAARGARPPSARGGADRPAAWSRRPDSKA